MRRLKEALRKFGIEVRGVVEQQAESAGIGELFEPFNAGILEVNQFDNIGDRMIDEYFDEVTESILSGITYPLFDYVIGDIIDSVIREGGLNPSQVSIERAKHVGLSSELLKRLPTFDNASMNEILDIRRELDKPLARFRSAVVRFSRGVRSASWERDFPVEAEQVFVELVRPAILDIEDQCCSNSFLKEFLPDFVEKPIMPLSTSGLGLLLAQATHLPEIVTTGLGYVAGTAVTALKAHKSLRQKLASVESNHLYFYHKAGEKLKRL